MQLTIERLNGEYLNWSLQWGQGRNDQDLKFGQYISNKYDIKARQLSNSQLDAFYNEATDKSYDIMYELLERLNTKNTL